MRVVDACLTDSTVAAAVHGVAQAGYRVEAERIGCTEFPPLRETVEELRDSPDYFLVCEEHGRMVGVLSYQVFQAHALITRLAVHPEFHRRGVATTLLRAVSARLHVGHVVHVWTAEANTAALRLYEGRGFQIDSSCVSPDGVALVHLSRVLV